MAGKATNLVVLKSYLLLPFSLLSGVGVGISQVWLVWKGIPAPIPPIHPLVNSTEHLIHLTWGDDWPWAPSPSFHPL